MRRIRLARVHLRIGDRGSSAAAHPPYLADDPARSAADAGLHLPVFAAVAARTRDGNGGSSMKSCAMQSRALTSRVVRYNTAILQQAIDVIDWCDAVSAQARFADAIGPHLRHVLE